MARARLVRRDADPDDARVVRVEMTARGRRVLAKGREMRIADIERRIRSRPASELRVLASALDVIERMLRD